LSKTQSATVEKRNFRTEHIHAKVRTNPEATDGSTQVLNQVNTKCLVPNSNTLIGSQ